MIQKIKEHGVVIGLIVAVALAVSSLVISWLVGEAEQFDDLTMVCLEYRGV